MAGEFLLEVGTEEIPSGYLDRALGDLKELARAKFKENRIDVSGGLTAQGTPRRIVLMVRGMAARQEDVVQEVTGPPKSVSYDQQGRPTKAAVGFAQRQGVSVESLQTISTPKGEYLYVRQRVPGRPVEEILREILPQLIGDIPWPKSMRWGSVGYLFVRPIHWIVALFDGKVVPFELAGKESGASSLGHRFMAPEAIDVSGVEDYLQKLPERFVLTDPDERRRRVEEAVEKAAAEVDGLPSEDPELLNTVVNLIEYPSAVWGSFDRAFLNLPEAVLITSMKEHQKYFGVYDRDKRLMPFFVAVNNTVARDPSVVRKGHERVLRARLSDADFFFREDRKKPLAGRLEDLKSVIYQADLGSSYAKVRRFTKLAEFLAESVLPEKVEAVKSTAELSKCDLVTHMVAEFPSLQGVMGKEYARLEGYPEEVCAAIREHYLPDRSGGALPESEAGAVVGVADRVDTIVGCFAVGLEPTGAADPFALRRHALAIIRILEGMDWDVSLTELTRRAISLLADEIDFGPDEVFGKVQAFVRERYKQLMLRSGYESDLVEAVISVDFDRIRDVRRRIEGLKAFSAHSEEFKPLVFTFKRITNILKKEEEALAPSMDLMTASCETALWEAYLAVRETVSEALEAGDYVRVLNLLAGLRKPVDDFFDGVEIMTKDDRLRKNRKGMLRSLSRLFTTVADFSKFSI